MTIFALIGGSWTDLLHRSGTNLVYGHISHDPRLHAELHLYRFIVSPSRSENPQIWSYFQLQHSVVAPSGGAETKSNGLTETA